MDWALTTPSRVPSTDRRIPLNVIVSFNLFRSQKHLAITRHAYAPNVIIMSKKTWQKLSPEQQKLVQESAQAAEHNRAYDNEKEEKWLQLLKDEGMEITMPDTALFRRL